MQIDKGAKLSLNSIGSLFSDTWSLYQERFTVLSEIVLLPALIMLLGYSLRYLGFPFSVLGGLVLLVGIIIFIFSSLALVFSIHHNTGVDESYRQTTRFFWPYIWMGLLALFAVFGASVMLIIPGIWLAFALVLRPYTLVLEKRKGIDALRQSKDYIKGYWWAILGRTVLVVIIFAVLNIIINMPFALIGVPALGAVASMIVTILIVPFAVILYYKIYENLRTLKPDVAETPASHGGFIKVAAIVGLIVAIIVGIAAVIGIVYLVQHPEIINNWQYQMSTNVNYKY